VPCVDRKPLGLTSSAGHTEDALSDNRGGHTFAALDHLAGELESGNVGR
jgi:hypothetical protein